MAKPYQKLQRFWNDTRSEIPVAPVSEEVIQKLELKYSVRLPDDFREYLRYSNPAEDSHMDVSDTCWWTVGSIRNLEEENCVPQALDAVANHASKYLLFADFLIWSNAWAIACGEDENRGRIVNLTGGGPDRFVAGSFGEFVDRIIVDSATLI